MANKWYNPITTTNDSEVKGVPKMTKEEIAKRFCKFELCTHRNGEGMCCLYNQDNCIFHRLEQENERLTVSYETLKLHDEEEIGMLKSENAELKETIADIEKNFRICESNADTYYDQLTKAKQIIKDLLADNTDWTNKLEAEQFLKE